MSNTGLRRVEVKGEEYLWRMWHHATLGWGGWSATLRVYASEHKHGWLEVIFAFEDRAKVFPDPQTVTYRWTGEAGLNIHQPKTVVRIIRYARKQLAWTPRETKTPLQVANGYQLLKDLGYQNDLPPDCSQDT